jgi:hypothetical protein
MVELSVPDKIVEYLREKRLVTISDVVQEFNVSEVTAMNYLSRLKNLGMANRIGYGKYEYGKPNDSSLIITPKVQKLIELVEKFGEKNILVWSINMLSNYSHYAIGNDLIFIETNSAYKKSIRDLLLQTNYNIVLDPLRRDFTNYTLNNRDTVFILSRKEKYGINKNEPIIPTAERIWVDLYYYKTRKDLNFSSFELGVILANMMESNILNYDRLLYYSKRRKIRDELIIILYELIKRTSNLNLFNLLVKGKNTVNIIDEILEGAIEQ